MGLLAVWVPVLSTDLNSDKKNNADCQNVIRFHANLTDNLSRELLSF